MSVPPWRIPKKTAYTAVSTNQRLNSAPSNSASSSQPQQQKQQWPDSLKRFIERCLNEGKDLNQDDLQKELKAVITKAFEEETTWAIDWDSVSLPILDAKRKDKKRASSLITPTDNTALGRSSVPASPYSNKKSKSGFALNESAERREKRQRRFESSSSSNGKNSSSLVDTSSLGTDPNEPLIGRSTQLEKKYFRLTSAPDPETVRPLHILKQTLDLLKQKWRQEQNYAYICDQFKSLRQDLTVQHIQNEFTVLVYEINARIALEKSDLGEYNQCQSQLNQLFAMKIDGNRQEFLAYRILYLCHTQNHAEIGHLLVDIDEQTLKNHAVSHALKVNAAMVTHNYHLLFKLYLVAPNMGGYVMDSFVTRERLYALSTICRAYRPSISITFVAKELGFKDGDSDSVDTQECLEFLNQFCTIDDNATVLDTKSLYATFEGAKQQAYRRVDIKGQI